MAEAADILTAPSVHVILPDLGAGCSMADMANIDQTLECWAQLEDICPDQKLIPITYVNSTAAIKAFVGEHGGAVCTSSNARKVLEWALAQTNGKPVKVLFFPDQHLGRNTAYAMGYPLTSMVTWDPRQDLGGSSPEALHDATFVLWKGHCSVHMLFRPEAYRPDPPEVPADESDRPPRMPVGCGAESRHERFHRADHEARRRLARRQPVGHRHRSSHGQSPRQTQPRQEDHHSFRLPVPLHHHVPHRPAPTSAGSSRTSPRARSSTKSKWIPKPANGPPSPSSACSPSTDLGVRQLVAAFLRATCCPRAKRSALTSPASAD